INYSDLVMVIHPSVPATNLKEFIAYAKSKPGELNYASSGPGTPYHMAAELFKAMSGTNLVHVPHKASGEMRNSVIGGHVQMAFDAITTMAPNVKAGQVRALGTSAAKRSSVLPDVPTIAEAGVPGYESTIWLGIMAPAGTRWPGSLFDIAHALQTAENVARSVLTRKLSARKPGEEETMLSAMKFQIILWGMAQLLRYAAWRYPAFRARLKERNLVAQLKARDEEIGRWYAIRDGKLTSGGGLRADAGGTLAFKTAAVGADLLMPPINWLDQINAQKDFKLTVEGPEDLSNWFAQTIMMSQSVGLQIGTRLADGTTRYCNMT